MITRRLWMIVSGLLITTLVLAACGGGGGAAQPAEQAASSEGEPSTCPEPNPRMEVTSTELNLFVWTEYIPQNTIWRTGW